MSMRKVFCRVGGRTWRHSDFSVESASKISTWFRHGDPRYAKGDDAKMIDLSF